MFLKVTFCNLFYRKLSDSTPPLTVFIVLSRLGHLLCEVNRYKTVLIGKSQNVKTYFDSAEEAAKQNL